MTKSDWLRLAQHFPIGGIAAWVTTRDALVGSLILLSTFVYEAFNDWRKGDASYKDVLGIVWGYGIVSIIFIVVGG